MTTTVYTFHLAENHAIRATATPSSLQEVAAQTARSMTSGDADTTRRVYVHNGLGVVAAGLCRQGVWHDIQRDDYRQFDEKAREQRALLDLHNDERPAKPQPATEQILTVRDAREYLLGQWTAAARYTADELDAMRNRDLIDLARMWRTEDRSA